jgi:hypothetical protein
MVRLGKEDAEALLRGKTPREVYEIVRDRVRKRTPRPGVSWARLRRVRPREAAVRGATLFTRRGGGTLERSWEWRLEAATREPREDP